MPGSLRADLVLLRQHCRLTICIELVELTNSIRRQDPNNNTDTETRCLVYWNYVLGYELFSDIMLLNWPQRSLLSLRHRNDTTLVLELGIVMKLGT